MNETHILTKDKENNIEEWIIKVLRRHLAGKNIEYRSSKTNWFNVEEDHKWDFIHNDYRIVLPRRYIIKMSIDGVPSIAETSDCWSDSDYGTDTDGTTYFLMEEIDH